MLRRLNALLKEMQRTPFAGTGKPELLRYNRAGTWSRRITEEHRWCTGSRAKWSGFYSAVTITRRNKCGCHHRNYNSTFIIIPLSANTTPHD